MVDRFKEVKACHILEIKARHPVIFVAYDKTRPHQVKEFISQFFKNPGFASIAILIVLEAHVDVKNYSTVMWKFFNNLDPKRDFYFVDGHLGIDVTRKYSEEGYHQDWPEEIVMSAEIKNKVNEKWNKMFGDEGDRPQER